MATSRGEYVFNFGRTCQNTSKGVLPFYAPPSERRVFQGPGASASGPICTVALGGEWRESLCGLVSVPLVTKGVCLYSFITCLFRYFPQFLRCLSVLVSCRSFKSMCVYRPSAALDR